MPTKALTQADVNMAKLLVLVADDLDEPLDAVYRELAAGQASESAIPPEVNDPFEAVDRWLGDQEAYLAGHQRDDMAGEEYRWSREQVADFLAKLRAAIHGTGSVEEGSRRFFLEVHSIDSAPDDSQVGESVTDESRPTRS